MGKRDQNNVQRKEEKEASKRTTKSGSATKDQASPPQSKPKHKIRKGGPFRSPEENKKDVCNKFTKETYTSTRACNTYLVWRCDG